MSTGLTLMGVMSCDFYTVMGDGSALMMSDHWPLAEPSPITTNLAPPKPPPNFPALNFGVLVRETCARIPPRGRPRQTNVLVRLGNSSRWLSTWKASEHINAALTSVTTDLCEL